MPPPAPSDHPAFRLHLLPNPFAVIQLAPGKSITGEHLAKITHAGADGPFVSITKTAEEISIVYEAQEDESSATWRCIKVAGPMDFGITGVMCNFSTPLKEAGIPIFAVSTWNTDYILIPLQKAGQAVDVLTQDGWTFDG